MSRMAEFRIGLADQFLLGFHEERGEVDPPNSAEPPMLRNIVDMDDDRTDPVPYVPMKPKF